MKKPAKNCTGKKDRMFLSWNQVKIKTILLISCLIFSVNVIGQTEKATIGIGRIQVSLNAPIPLYATFDDPFAYDTILFGRVTEGDNKGKFTMDVKLADIKALSFYEGDSEKQGEDNMKFGLVYVAPKLIFKVLKTEGDSYKVVLNEKTLETAIIRLGVRELYTKGEPYWIMRHNSSEYDNEWLLYETWDIHIKRLMSVIIDEINIYNSPNGKFVQKSSGRFYTDSVKGQWIRIRKEEYRLGNLGWIRWTDGKVPLIRLVEEIYF